MTDRSVAVRFESDEGDRPVMIVAQRTETEAILDRIHDLVGSEGFTHNEIGVLVLRNRDAERLVAALKNRTVPCVNLKDLRDGPLEDGVRIGTFDRAKGMEFRAVFIPRLGESRFPIDTEDRRSGAAGDSDSWRPTRLRPPKRTRKSAC